MLTTFDSSSELLQQVRLLDPVTGTDRIVDVLIANGKIEAIADKLAAIPEDTTVRGCRGLILGPGLVDIYSHSGEPGHEERETLSSLTAAAWAGGFTRLNILPNTVPPLDNPQGLALLKQRYQATQASLGPQIDFWGALTQGLRGENMSELAELSTAGIVGFSDGLPLNDWGLLRRLLEYLQPLNKPVGLVANHRQLVGNGVMREGGLSLQAGLPGNPAVSETATIAAVLELISDLGVPVHFMRLSTARGVELLAAAKQRGLNVTASTTWMHLLLNTEAVTSYDTNLRLEPPLGNPEDQLALVEGVRSGVIDAIAIDHCAYTYEEKTVAFAEAPPGAIGLELALPLLWQNLVHRGQWSPLDLWQALSLRPKKSLQQQVHHCSAGQKAELVLFDPQESWRVLPQNLRSLSQNTPWLGKKIKGRVIKVWN